MGWTVIKEDENGNAIRTLSKELHLSNIDILYNENFKVLKYIDPFGDTTFNAHMFTDLISDLNDLTTKIPSDKEQIDEVIELATECKEEVHTYLKFYGD